MAKSSDGKQIIFFQQETLTGQTDVCYSVCEVPYLSLEADSEQSLCHDLSKSGSYLGCSFMKMSQKAPAVDSLTKPYSEAEDAIKLTSEADEGGYNLPLSRMA